MLLAMRLGYESNGRLASIGRWTMGVATAAAVGCGDDQGVTGDGSGTAGTSTGEATSTGATTQGAEESTAGSQGGESSTSGGSSSDSTTGEPVTEVSIGGTIEDFFLMMPIADAQISVYGQSGFETTSDAKGAWVIPGLAPNTFDRFVIADSETYWGAVVHFETEEVDVDDFELSQVSLQVIDIQIAALQEQDPTVMVEEETAVLLVAINQNTATGAVVTVDPMPPMTEYYAPDAGGQPILGQNEVQWSLYPVAVFYNLEPGPEGTYSISVTHPERECTVADPEPPTFARHINLIRVDCLPPE
jgi:hypothetical protein